MSGSVSLPLLTTTRARRAHAPASPARRLIDSHGRVIRDLRLSITDRCNFRCVYCMDPGVRFADPAALLSVDELVRVAQAAATLGIRHIRLTGGEPTLHPKLDSIIRRIAALGLDDLAMTTNGSLITPERALAWKHAGLSRLTFSLDSADPAVFARMTRSRTDAGAVHAAITAAKAAGLGPIKVNAVIVRGLNETEILGLVRLAIELDIEMRFIEYMPLDSAHAWARDKLVPADEILTRAREAADLTPLGKPRDSSTADTYAVASAPRTPRIGLIAPVTRPFCGQCSRLRITADGQVRPCLFSREEFDLRALLRSGAPDADIERFLIDATWTKQRAHGITAPGFVQPDRPMSAIGG